MGGSSKKQTVGYRYYFGVHMGICRGPVNELVEVRVGDRSAWPYASQKPITKTAIVPAPGGRGFNFGIVTYSAAESYTPPPITYSQPVLIGASRIFGGEDKEGGIQGWMWCMFGEPTQTPPPELQAMLGGNVPGFRGMFTVFFDGLIACLNPYPKPWKFRVRRTTAGWDGTVFRSDIAKIVIQNYIETPTITSSPDIHAMNPAHIIYEVLTNREWGRGLDPSRLNTDSFEEAAETLYAEGFGLCLKWSRRDAISSFIQNVLDHIAGTIYTDRSTALLTLKLIRGDYDESTLPLFDETSGLLEIRDYDVASIGGSINEVVVTYTDPLDNTDKTVRVHNIASVQAAGGSYNSLKKTYSGVPTSALALRLAQRDLRANSLALRKFTLSLDRRAISINPGDAFRIQSTSRGLKTMVVRAGRVENGTLNSGKITITAVQDAFSMPSNSFVIDEFPQWEPPSITPCVAQHKVFEVPYFLLRQMMTNADFNNLTDESAYMGAVLARGQPQNNGYEIAVKSGASTVDEIPDDDSSYCGYTPS